MSNLNVNNQNNTSNDNTPKLIAQNNNSDNQNVVVFELTKNVITALSGADAVLKKSLEQAYNGAKRSTPNGTTYYNVEAPGGKLSLTRGKTITSGQFNNLKIISRAGKVFAVAGIVAETGIGVSEALQGHNVKAGAALVKVGIGAAGAFGGPVGLGVSVAAAAFDYFGTENGKGGIERAVDAAANLFRQNKIRR